MTAPALGAVMGRPATTVSGLTRSLERSRLVNASLREQLRAERLEALELATEARARAHRMHLATVAERPDLALHEAGAIVTVADRFLRQRSGGVL
jgi:hypothetical protein